MLDIFVGVAGGFIAADLFGAFLLRPLVAYLQARKVNKMAEAFAQDERVRAAFEVLREQGNDG